MEFLTILKESIKLLRKNGKLMALIALLSILLASTFFMLFYYYILSLSQDMLLTITKAYSNYPSPFTPQMFISLMRQDFAFILGAYFAGFLVISTIGFFLSISTIIASSLSYKDQSSSLKGLISGIRSSWISFCITSLYVSALASSCSFALVMLVSPLFVYPSPVTYFISIFIGIISYLFYLHLVVSWILAIIVSVLEESCYGLEALVKGSQLVKGKRFDGLLLNICFAVGAFIIFQVCKTMLLNKEYVYNPMLYGWILVCASLLANMFQIVAYTVLYLRCKKQHDEEMELKGGFQYTRLPITQVVNDIP